MSERIFLRIFFLLFVLAAGLRGCGSIHTYSPIRTLVVNATGYTSSAAETWGDPFEAAWGDRLSDGMRAVAVSRDLLDLGFTRGVRLRIEGLPGTYVILDKMARRWRRKIDIYFGQNSTEARNWGRRQVRITKVEGLPPELPGPESANP